MPTPVAVSAQELGSGDGHTIVYSGTLPNGRILAGSLSISDSTETFIDSGVNTLAGDKGGSGTINRFNGEYSLTFMQPPAVDVPIIANYMYYPNSSDVNTLGEFKSDYVTNTMLGISDEYAEGAGYTYDLNDDDTFDDNDRVHLIKWVQGFADSSEETQREWLLDAIDHSTPALAGPPALPAWYYGIDISEEEREAFDAWARTLKHRRSVLYIGSRSGMLHAFDAGAFQHGDNPATDFMEHRGYFASSNGAVDYGTGEELWAFIPNNCLARLKYHVKRTLVDADPPYVDASPSIEDIFYRVGNELVFKTLLFSAEGNGGDTVLALDITNPYNPSFMWEFGNPALWRSKSSSPIGKIVRVNAGGEAKWVVLFVSGQTDADQHPSVFMVDALSGALLKNIELDAPGDANLGALLSGSPAIVDANGNGYVDRFYVGDDKGHIYRANIPDNSSTVLDLDEIQNCVLVKVSQPVYASPSVYPQNTYNDAGYVSEYHMKIMFGTGDSPYLNDEPNYSGTTYKFYVFDDTCGPLGLDSKSRDNSGSECTCSQIQEEEDAVWSWNLPAGERIWAEAYAAAGVVYFGTSTADTADPCSSPTTGSSHGSLYSLDLSALPEQPSIVRENIGNVMGIVVEDEHIYVKANKPDEGTRLSSYGDGTYNNDVGLGVDFATSKLPGSWRQIVR
jgi:Tfp pilus tip-associated adhesin PilY1